MNELGLAVKDFTLFATRGLFWQLGLWSNNYEQDFWASFISLKVLKCNPKTMKITLANKDWNKYMGLTLLSPTRG